MRVTWGDVLVMRLLVRIRSVLCLMADFSRSANDAEYLSCAAIMSVT